MVQHGAIIPGRKNRSCAREMPGVPPGVRENPNLNLQFTGIKSDRSERGEAGSYAEYQGPIKPYEIVNVSGSYAINPGTTIGLGIENLYNVITSQPGGNGLFYLAIIPKEKVPPSICLCSWTFKLFGHLVVQGNSGYPLFLLLYQRFSHLDIPSNPG